MKNNKLLLNKNIKWHNHYVTIKDRFYRYNHNAFVFLFTGLSGSGKSTIANIVYQKLFLLYINSYLLDGDNLRYGLCSDLNFSVRDRNENIRRISEVSKILLDVGFIVLISSIFPYYYNRDIIKNVVSKSSFFEVFVDTPIEICQQRDPKFLYKNYTLGKIKNFTGLDDIYQRPLKPSIYLDGSKSLIYLVKKIFNYFYIQNIINFGN